MRKAALAAALLAAALIGTLAVPLEEWRTGDQKRAPLTYAPPPPLALPSRVWIDTDAACGHGERTDPDDCFAILLLARAAKYEIAGISAVAGNAVLEAVERTGAGLAAQLELSFHGGGARDALAAALEAGPLIILALGPLTNIAKVLEARPDLRPRVARIVAVMGRRPGHIFHPAENAAGASLLGHGPVFRDFNFAMDPDAAAGIVASGVPLTLVPYDAARGFELTGADLDRLAAAGGAAAWLAERARAGCATGRRTSGATASIPSTCSPPAGCSSRAASAVRPCAPRSAATRRCSSRCGARRRCSSTRPRRRSRTRRRSASRSTAAAPSPTSSRAWSSASPARIPAEGGLVLNSLLARIARRFVEPPPGLDPGDTRYYAAARYGYPIALAWHAAFIGVFALAGATALAWINVASVAIWVTLIWLHLAGHLRAAGMLAFFEVTAHAILAVMLVGWDTGFQYYLFVLAAALFFTALGPMPVKAAACVLLALVFAGLYFLYGSALPRIALTPWVGEAMYYGNALSAFFVICVSVANYDMVTLRAQGALAREKARSEEMAALLRTMFGRYLAPEVMASLLENPAGLELGGEKRRVTVMLTDLRGFTALAERLAPEQVVRVLNGYFEVMLEVIERHHGTVNEIIGDALLVLFGAPLDMPDRAERAVACAIEMQNAMAEVNARNRAAGLPELEMGIGLNDTEVVVGNVGSAKRSKYAAVGAGVNLASRIESFTVGGQVLVSESVRRAAGDQLRIDGQREVLPKGAEAPLRIYEVGGIGGRFNVALAAPAPELLRLAEPEPVRFALLEGKEAGAAGAEGTLVRLARTHAELCAEAPPALFSDLRFRLAAAGERLAGRDFYGKVVAAGPPRLVRFTALPPEVDAYLEALRRRASR